MAKDGTLRLVLQDTRKNRLNERVDVVVRHQVLSDERIFKNVNAGKVIVINDLHSEPQGTYRISVDPPSYMAATQFINVKSGARTDLTMTFPIDPKKIKGVTFPAFSMLSEHTRVMLTESATVSAFEGRRGGDLYDAVDTLRRAGFLNIVAKAGATRLSNGRTVLEYLGELRDMHGDRFIAVVPKELRDETAHSIADGIFRSVDGSLHHPPAPGFTEAGSFKTEDHYGNLQLTFFLSGDDCLVDVDIDDAAGLAHVFQVARNELSGRPTHPFDIREILIYFQGIDPGYTFEV